MNWKRERKKERKWLHNPGKNFEEFLLVRLWNMHVPAAASSSTSALPDFSSSIFYPSYRMNISQLYSLKVCLSANFMLFRNINQIFGDLKFWNIWPGYSYFVPDFFYLPWTLTLSLMKRLWEPLEPKFDNENDVRFFVPLDFGLIKPISNKPDEPFHNFRASASGDWRILCSSKTSCDEFWGTKIVKGFVGNGLT